MMKCIVFTEWITQRAIGVSLAEMTVDELDKNSRFFYAEARDKERDNDICLID